MKFQIVIAIILNLNFWIHKNFVSQLQGHENVMKAKNGNFSVFSSSWKIDWSNFFSRSHQKIFMIFDHNLQRFHQYLKNFY